MTERFFDISHLTTDQLRELFTEYRKFGWIDYEYIEISEANQPIQKLSDPDIILNIQSGNEGNYLVFMLDYEDEKDGIMIGFGLTYHQEFCTFLHLPPSYLNELISRYNLIEKETPTELTIEQFLIEQSKNQSMN